MRKFIYNIYIKNLNVFIIMSFIICSIISVIFIQLHNTIYFTGDAPFHIERIIELLKSNSIMPQYALNSFNKSGSSVILMYPYVFLYFITFLFKVIKSFKYTIYFVFIIGTFLTLSISYYSSLKFSKDKRISYLFSLIYSLSYEFTALYFTHNVIGIYFSSIFLPLVIFGFVYYIKYNQWLMLSIGMSLILCNSLITFVFLSILLFILLLFNYRSFKLSKIKYLVKAVLLTMTTTAFIWIPILRMTFTNKIRTPNTISIQPILFFHVLAHTVIPSSSIPAQSLTISSLFGIFIGFLMYKKLPYLLKILYLYTIFILILFSDVFPWKIFNGSFGLFKLIRSIQTNYRILVVPQLILAYILAYGIIYYMNHVRKNVKPKPLILCIVCFIVLLQFSGQIFSLKSSGINRVVTNSSLTNVNWANYDNGYHHDYYPKALTDNDLNNLDNNDSIYHHHIIHFNKLNNGNVYFNTKHYINKLTIPFIDYNKVLYDDSLDNRKIKALPNKRQLMTIRNVNPGQHHLHIQIKLDKYTIAGRIITILSIPIYGLIINYMKKRHYNVKL